MNYLRNQSFKMIILNNRHIAFACLLCLLTGCASADHIITTVGTDVTLRCSYDVQFYGRLGMCWGRGAIPNSGCADEVLKADGTSVISRLSERYLLMGNLGEGDVSLTIRQVEESDSGTYGCRVDIPGWFNDQKHHVTLTVNAARPAPLKVEAREVKERTITVRWTLAFDGGRPITEYIIDLKNKYALWDTAIRTVISQPQLTQVTLMDLHPAKTYNIRMFAVNSVGMSDASNALTLTTKEAAPQGPPLDMRLEAQSSNSIRVSWKPPKVEDRNGVLQSYRISYREYDPLAKLLQRWEHLSVPFTGELESTILMNLNPSTKYSVSIQAKTKAGIGPASIAPPCSTLEEVHKETVVTSPSSISATMWMQHTGLTSAETISSFPFWEETTTSTTMSIASVSPDPPVVEVKEVKDNTFSLIWTPGFEGDSPIIGYYLEYKAANASWDYSKNVVDYGPNQREATIIEINPSTYNIRMFAKNSLSTSKASNVLTITTGEAGSHRDSLIATISTDTDVSTEDSPGVHPAAIFVPVVMVVLTGAVVTLLLLRKKHKTSMTMWLTNGVMRYRGAESLQEL
ncbi:Down syndrome cell adhesion molecule homolog isoform X2 [Melanotaenia boesemani]|uniref:Down syndrome cell adhesion molecule homolog isoform X2 n=1 Tax=Melanotaenia boesemani TaxID=1250792 RepID=UPI001C04D463|nr:Down syndrome cell adhesion molecule homolog isoform X2 [Melanotaenia boesemani]